MTVLAAAATAVGVLLAGSLPWAGFGRISGLASLNLRVWTRVPWSLVPMALYLAVYWSFLDGAWGASPESAVTRRATLRAHRLSWPAWAASAAAGACGFMTILAFLGLMARLVTMPGGPAIETPPGMPAITVVLLLATQAAVAGVSEESAFRGYMQSIVERDHGPVVAVVASGVLFGLLHFGNHPADVLMMLPYYVVVSAVYGGMTWAADSILPALVFHSVGDVVVLTRWWATGLPEWQLTATPPPLVRDHGVDAQFIVLGVAAIALAAVTAALLAQVRRLRSSGGVPAPSPSPAA